jgi:DNA-binding beta-propeller fold protein YncE
MEEYVKNMYLMSLLLFVSVCPLNAQFSSSVYVVNGLSETLSKIDLGTGMVYEDIVPLGSLPNDILVRNDRAYVVNSGSSDLYVIDLVDESVILTMDLGEGNNPWSCILSNDSTMYITNWLTHTLSKLDLPSGLIVDTLDIGTGPEGLLLIGDLLYVANSGWNGSGYDQGTVSVLNVTTDSLVAIIPVGTNPQDLVLDPQGEIHVICTGDYVGSTGAVHLIDSATNSVTDTVVTGGAPGRATISPMGHLYMAAGGWVERGEIYLFDTMRGILVHDVGNPIQSGPGAMDVVTDSEGYLYAASFSENSVSVFDIPDDSVNTYTVGSGPVAIAIREEPWIEIVSEPGSHFVQKGGTLNYSASLNHRGSRDDTVSVMSMLLLPGGVLFDGNPLMGPVELTLIPGSNLYLDRSETIPPSAPAGRYVLFGLAKDNDSRRMAIDSFWFHVVP